jgi:hypothetical protein
MVFNDRFVIFFYFLSCLGLINTLFSARIQGLFGLSYKLFSLGSVLSGPHRTHKGSIRVNFPRTI